LNPTDAVGDVVFENVIAGLAGTETFVGNLRLTAGSNVLYSIDTAAAVDLCTYTDTLAKPVALESPANASGLDNTTRVSFDWEDLNADTVVQYQIWVNEEDDFPAATDEQVGTVVPPSDLVADNAVTWRAALAGTSYNWKVRVALGQPYLSRWSEAWSFTTQLGQVAAPIQVSPAPGAQDIIISPTFDWLAVGGANSYEIQIAPNDMFLASEFITSGTSNANAWAIDVTLDYDTPYYWRVRGLKDGAPVGDWVVSIFRTIEEPAAPMPPVVVEQAPAQPTPVIEPTPVSIEEIAPTWIYAIVGIGAALAIVVIVLIVRTRKTP
jgi:hypothetical protein